MLTDTQGRPIIPMEGQPIAMMLIPWPSGITIEVQCQGLGVRHRAIEGIMLPFTYAWSNMIHERLELLHDTCAYSDIGCFSDGITEAGVAAIESAWAEWKDSGTAEFTINRARLAESTEAWIWGFCNIEPFVGHECVLTWGNCD